MKSKARQRELVTEFGTEVASVAGEITGRDMRDLSEVMKICYVIIGV